MVFPKPVVGKTPTRSHSHPERDCDKPTSLDRYLKQIRQVRKVFLLLDSGPQMMAWPSPCWAFVGSPPWGGQEGSHREMDHPAPPNCSTDWDLTQRQREFNRTRKIRMVFKAQFTSS